MADILLRSPSLYLDIGINCMVDLPSPKNPKGKEQAHMITNILSLIVRTRNAADISDATLTPTRSVPVGL